MGRRKEAARLLLAAARARPGSVVGIWAADRLMNILPRRMPLSDEARRLEELIEGIGRSFDRYPESPSLALEFHIEPVSEVFQPYDPLILNLMITNRTPHPLAIDRDGPVRPQVLLFFSTTLARIRAGTIAPTVVSIDRRLRLEPHETLVVPVDLRRYRLGDVLSTRASRGTFVRVKGLINFVATRRGAIEPGLLGSSDWSDTIRIEGTRLSPFWLRGAVAALADPNDPGDMVTLALLGQVSAYQISEEAPPQLFQIVAVARDQIVRTFVQLDGPRMAWVLSTFPPGGLLEQIRLVAQRSDDRLVKMVYLMFHLTGPSDPLLDIARGSDDPHIRRLAEQSSVLFEYIHESNRDRRQQGGR